MTTTLRQQVETDMTSWAEWHRSHGRAVSRRTEQAMTEADARAQPRAPSSVRPTAPRMPATRTSSGSGRRPVMRS